MSLALLSLLSIIPGRAATAAEPDDWQQTLDRVAQAVVSVKIDRTRAFDGDWNASSQATGFVVDAERGLLLTNRHVVSPGPTRAKAVFLDHEEVSLKPIYRDPVHDFGVYRFDPAALEFQEVIALPLSPDRAAVGEEIRVVGNDAGEKLSILSGTLARLDRAAPRYGSSRFNDFNTFYLQAASGTSGGSSGSPVVNRDGHVIGLNAGGKTRAASSFYLPLDRVVRAIDLLQQGQPVTRGTIQTVFTHESYDELRRLGLSKKTATEARTTAPDSTGLLVVREIVPGGPADGVLRQGDVLVSVSGHRDPSFVDLEARLDDAVGQTLTLEVERGGEAVSVDITVGDLHAITPATFLEVGGAVLHDLSYQQARNTRVPVKGVYVADPGFVFEPAGIARGDVITEIAGQPTPRVADAERLLADLPDGEAALVRTFHPRTPHRSRVHVIFMDRSWFPMRHCVRDDTDGAWPCTESDPPPAASALAPATATIPTDGPKPKRVLAPSLVDVHFRIPFQVDGVYAERYRGTGLIVDAAEGLVVVDRDTVPVRVGEVRIGFGGQVEVPGQVRYLDPIHNVAVVSYDPAAIGDTPARSAAFVAEPAEPGDRLWLVGLQEDGAIGFTEAAVPMRDAPDLPAGGAPRYRETNVDLLVSSASAPSLRGGVLADKKGQVAALWASFAYREGDDNSAFWAGLPAEVITAAVERARTGAPVYDLGLELAYVPLADARRRGLSDDWAALLSEAGDGRHQVLMVMRRVAGSPASELVREGDLLLGVGGRPVATMADVERATHHTASAVLTLGRGAETVEVTVETEPLSGDGTDRFVLWAGAVLQEPHRAARLAGGIPSEGVYASLYFYGSPFSRSDLGARRAIIAVDEQPVADLDAFLAQMADRADRDTLRVESVDTRGRRHLDTVELDLIYWPTEEVVRGEDGWQRVRHSAIP